MEIVIPLFTAEKRIKIILSGIASTQMMLRRRNGTA
jgi:hypothetical protein